MYVMLMYHVNHFFKTLYPNIANEGSSMALVSMLAAAVASEATTTPMVEELVALASDRKLTSLESEAASSKDTETTERKPTSLEPVAVVGYAAVVKEAAVAKAAKTEPSSEPLDGKPAAVVKEAAVAKTASAEPSSEPLDGKPAAVVT
jgi:hypothetical protein